MALALSTLRMGFLADDYAFVAALDGVSPQRLHPLALYDFASGNEAANHELMRRGPFPWWTAPDLKVRFFRPISSALFSVDHAIFGHGALGYHLQSLLWFLVLLLGVAFVYRRVLSPAVCGWSFLSFAVSAHLVESVGWIASRHILIACGPALLGLAAHLRYREEGWSPGRWLSVLGLAVGLLGGESALAVGFYWIAYEMAGAPESAPLLDRARRSAVPVLPVALYLGLYKVFDFGAAHTSAYHEPLSAPFRFAAAAFERAPVLLGQLFAQIPAGLVNFLSPTPFMIAGFVATLMIAGLVAATWPLLPPADRRAVRWLALGGALSLFTSVGAYPGSRVLLMPGIGAAAVLGTVLGYGWQAVGAGSLGRLSLVGRRVGWVVLFGLHLVASPLLFVANAEFLGSVGQSTFDIAASLDDVLRPTHTSKAPSVFIIASDPMAGLYAGAAGALRSTNTPSAWCMLSMARATHRIRRADLRTLVITVDPGMLYGSFENVFRSSDLPFFAGDEVELDAATVKVIAAKEGHPTAIEVAFKASSADDPELRILAWMNGRLQLVPIPDVGGSVVEVPWSPGPMGMF